MSVKAIAFTGLKMIKAVIFVNVVCYNFSTFLEIDDYLQVHASCVQLISHGTN